MPNISDTLFSKTQQKVIGLLFGQPDRSFYLNEIVRVAGMGKGTIKRELDKMTASGLLTMNKIGNQSHYQANASSPVFNELRSISRKTFGIADLIHQALADSGLAIEYAFIYGSIAKNTDDASSDIDLMIIGDDLAYSDVMSSLMSTEKELQRTINPSIYTAEAFKHKLAQGSSFVNRVMEQEKIVIMGNGSVIG